MKNPVLIAPEALDFAQLIRAGETVGWAEATAEPVFLTRRLNAQADSCPPFRVFCPLTFSNSLSAAHRNVTITSLGGASAGRRFFTAGADNVIPATSPIFAGSSGTAVCRSTLCCCRPADHTKQSAIMPGSVLSTCTPRLARHGC